MKLMLSLIIDSYPDTLPIGQSTVQYHLVLYQLVPYELLTYATTSYNRLESSE
jgi:hypothetical protein